MLVTDDGIVTDVREVHCEKAPLPIEVTDDRIVIDVRDLQPLKAFSPMVVTDDGIVIDARDLQSEKALSPMVATDDGIMIVLRVMQLEKAESGILVVPLAMMACPFTSGVTKQLASAPFHPSKSTSKSVVFITFYDRSTLMSRILRSPASAWSLRTLSLNLTTSFASRV
jgi:hypothetical protein